MVNVVLIVVTVVVAVLAVGVALYLLIGYQHPEDRLQAWFPENRRGVRYIVGNMDGAPLPPRRGQQEDVQLGLPNFVLHLHHTHNTAVVCLLHRERGDGLRGHPLRDVLL